MASEQTNIGIISGQTDIVGRAEQNKSRTAAGIFFLVILKKILKKWLTSL